MSHNEYIFLSSEIKELESLLAEIPEENMIERIGLEARLESAREELKRCAQKPVYKARLIFRGKPVFDSHGIAADFASRAAGAFTEAVLAVAAGLNENLKYMGPIPDKQKNQLLIIGTAIGSFGFEFELPQSEDPEMPNEPSRTENALQKVQELFRLAATGSDDDMAELVDEIHPRAVKKASDFLSYIAQHEAWCGLEFKENYFRFNDLEQLNKSKLRLQEDYIHEKDDVYTGEFQGILPSSRTFEFKLADSKDVLKGKIGIDIKEPDTMNYDFLHKPVNVRFHIIQVGKGRPRYTLLSMDAIRTVDNPADQQPR